MSHSVTPPRRTWPWVVVVIAAVIVIVAGASLTSALIGGGEPQAAPASPVPAPATSVTPTPTVVPSSPTASPTATALTASDTAAIEKAIDDNDPTGLYDYLADPVHITFAASDFDSDRSRDLAITDLAYVSGSTGWNWNLDEATLAAFRAGTYKNYFPDDAIIGQSAESYVIAFTVTGTEITRVFVSKSAAIVTEAPAPTP